MGNLTKEQAIEKIKARELAIENDGNKEALKKCLEYFWPDDRSGIAYVSKIYGQCKHSFHNWSTLNLAKAETIPATKLLKLLEGEKEWMPTVGEEYEFSNDFKNGIVIRAEYFGKGTADWPYLCKYTDNSVGCRKFCRPIQKLKITVSAVLIKAGLDPKEWEVVNE